MLARYNVENTKFKKYQKNKILFARFFPMFLDVAVLFVSLQAKNKVVCFFKETSKVCSYLPI